MSGLPAHSNLFGRVSLPNPRDAAPWLERAGWQMRKAGFTEFEAISEESELIIEGAAPVLIHGSCRRPDITAQALATLFQTACIAGSFEVYDAAGNLTATIASK